MLRTKITLLLLVAVAAYVRPFPIKHLGVKEGLSNNYIVDIAQDKQGCIWIATESGLNRFDGMDFTTYTTSNSGLVSNELNTLLFDREENTLWIGTQREGISLFNCSTQSFTRITSEEGLVTNDVTNLSHASDGGIWITHYHVGVEHYDKTTKQLTVYSGETVEGLRGMNWCSLDDGNGHLYIGHVDHGLSIVNLADKTLKSLTHIPGDPHSLPGNSVHSLYIDSYKNIWLGTNRGLALFDPETNRCINFTHNPRNPDSLGSDNIYAIREMKDGTLWICTDMSGISILNLSNLTLRDPRHVVFKNLVAAGNPNDLSSPNIRAVFQDSFDNIWIGNYRKGIDIIGHNRPVFQTLSYTEERLDKPVLKQVWSMCIDNKQQVWVGGDREIALFREGQFIKRIDMSLYLPYLNRYVTAIKCDRQGNLWLGIYHRGVVIYQPETGRARHLAPEVLSNLYIRHFYEDAEGKMWISTESGLYSCYKNEVKYEEKITEAVEDKVIYSFMPDRQGKMWVGSFGKGIHVFDAEGNLLLNLSIDQGFCSNAINDLYMDSRGGIWVATRRGVAHFANTNSPLEYVVYDETSGLENAHVRAIQEDLSGRIWVSTNAGISLLNEKENSFDNFNHQDGVPLGDFINGCALVTANGDLYFASLNGISFFNPKNLERNYSITPVEIISVEEFGKNIENQSEETNILPIGDKINLPYDRNSFRITFAVPNYALSGQMEYAYTMEGLEKIWYSLKGENEVSFRNIPPGKYTFKVKARLKNRQWEEKSLATLPVHIYPPIWLSWYARLAYAFLIFAGIYFWLRAYKNKVQLKSSLELEKQNSRNKQELNEERLRFYTNITHELRTPLTLILGPLEDLLHDKKLPDFFRNKIGIIHSSALQLLNLINQILEFRKTETQNRRLTVSKGDLANLVTEVGLRYKELNQNTRIAVNVSIETNRSVLYYDTDMVTSILNNLLSNALKYTVEGEIRLTLRSTVAGGREYTEIEVSDTGYGIDSQALPHIFDRYYQAKGKHQASGTGIGLALVKSLAELHEGELRVNSSLGKGTSFVLRLITNNTYPEALHTEHVQATETAFDADSKEENNMLSRALVIEDNPDICKYIATSLSADYQVLTAMNGRQGLELAQQHIPDIIVSDIMMPEMDGIELCSLVKKDIRTSHIPVILLTAKDSIQDREEGYESGADSYLTKPFSAKLLRSRIQNLMESRKRLARQLMALPQRDSENTDREQPDIRMSQLDKDFLDKLTNIIEENIDLSMLDVAFLRERMFMSGSTFYRKVKGLTNLSPNEFIRKIRLRKGAEFLLSGKYTVSEAAYLAGFNDGAYFRVCFKEEYGMTPTEYMKRKGANEFAEE